MGMIEDVLGLVVFPPASGCLVVGAFVRGSLDSRDVHGEV